MGCLGLKPKLRLGCGGFRWWWWGSGAGADELDEVCEVLAGEFLFEAFGHEADAGGLEFGDIGSVECGLLISAAGKRDGIGCFCAEDTGDSLAIVSDGDELQEVRADFAIGVKDLSEQFCWRAVFDSEQAGSDIGAEVSHAMAGAAFLLEDVASLLTVAGECQGILPCGEDL